MHSAVIDIETTSLGAVGAGIVLCACIRPTDTHRTRIFRLDGHEFKTDKTAGFLSREEKQLLIDINNEISKYKILIGHNIERFDWPYLKSRAFQRGVQFTARPSLYDTLKAFRRASYLTVPNGFGKPSGGLAHVVDFFGIRQEKNGVYPVEFWESVWGNDAERTEALNYVVDHCQRDVRMNDQIFDYLWGADPRPQIKRVYA